MSFWKKTRNIVLRTMGWLVTLELCMIKFFLQLSGFKVKKKIQTILNYGFSLLEN